MAFNFGNFGGFGLSSLFGSSNSFYSSLGDYNSIRTGSYKKLLRSYYAATKSEETSSKKTDSKKDNKDYLKTLTNQKMVTAKEKADKLSSSAAKLADRSSDSLFAMKYMTVKDSETGKESTVKDYDRKAIDNAVKNFVSDYNAVIQSTVGSSVQAVKTRGQNMVQQTSLYKTSLENVGITINADNTLTVDEKKLGSADIADLKSVFNGTSSFGGQTATRATMLSQAASRASTSSIYGQSGGYTGYVNSLFNTYS